MKPRTLSVLATAAMALAMLAFIVLSILFPEADPTRVLPGFTDHYRAELLVEAPAKAHEARNWALFGEWHRNPVDDYQFWRIQSPLWVYPLAWAFRIFGVSYTVLRCVSVVYAIIAFAGFLALTRKGLPAPLVAIGAWLLASNLFYSQVARSGLLEVALNAAAVWMVYALLKAKEHPGWLVASQALFTGAFFIKAGIVYAFPLLVIVNLWTFLQYRASGDFPRLRWLPLVTAVGFAALAVFWVAQPEYQRVLAWNTSHLIAGGTSIYSAPWYARFDAYRIFQTGYLLFPGLGLLGIPAIAWLATRVVTDRFNNRFEALLLAWIVSCVLALAVSRIWTIRHASIVFLPNMVVILWALRELWAVAKRAGAPARGLRTMLAGAVAVAFMVQIGHHVRHFSHLKHQRWQVSQGIQQRLGDQDAVFIGRLAMPVLMDSPYDIFYVKHGFNTEPEQIRALKPTHMLRRPEDLTDEFLVGDVLPRRRHLNTYAFWSRPLRLERVGGRAARRPPKPTTSPGRPALDRSPGR